MRRENLPVSCWDEVEMRRVEVERAVACQMALVLCTNQDEFHAQQTPDDQQMKSAEDSVAMELCPMRLAADAFDLALVLDTCERLVRPVAVDDAVVDWMELVCMDLAVGSAAEAISLSPKVSALCQD